MALLAIVVSTAWIFIQDDDKGRITGITTAFGTLGKAFLAATVIVGALWCYRILSAHKGLTPEKQWDFFRAGLRLYLVAFFGVMGFTFAYFGSVKFGLLGINAKDEKVRNLYNPEKAKAGAAQIYQTDINRARKANTKNPKKAKRLHPPPPPLALPPPPPPASDYRRVLHIALGYSFATIVTGP